MVVMLVRCIGDHPLLAPSLCALSASLSLPTFVFLASASTVRNVRGSPPTPSLPSLSALAPGPGLPLVCLSSSTLPCPSFRATLRTTLCQQFAHSPHLSCPAPWRPGPPLPLCCAALALPLGAPRCTVHDTLQSNLQSTMHDTMRDKTQAVCMHVTRHAPGFPALSFTSSRCGCALLPQPPQEPLLRVAMSNAAGDAALAGPGCPPARVSLYPPRRLVARGDPSQKPARNRNKKDIYTYIHIYIYIAESPPANRSSSSKIQRAKGTPLGFNGQAGRSSHRPTPPTREEAHNNRQPPPPPLSPPEKRDFGAQGWGYSPMPRGHESTWPYTG